LTDLDGFGLRAGQHTVLHIREDLPVWARDAAAGELLRQLHSVPDTYVSAGLPADTAVTIPSQRGVRSIRR
jgi:hypothetical protein